MRDNANGRLGIGIGIFTPTEVLDVNGTGKFTSVQIGDTMSLLSSSSYGVIQSATGLAFNTSGDTNPKMIIDKLGNIGIGASTLTAKLTVNGSINLHDKITFNAAGLIYPRDSNHLTIHAGDMEDGSEEPGGTLNLFGGNCYGQNCIGGDIIIMGGTGEGQKGGNVYINGGYSSHDDGNVILGNIRGKIGIGTSNPQAKLEVNNSIRITPSGSAPFSCDSAHAGSIATNLNGVLCYCNGLTNLWKYINESGNCVR